MQVILQSRSKAKAKAQRRDSAGSSTRTILIGERTWTDVEPGKYSLSDYQVSKKLIHLLRHGSPPREDDGAVQFWRIKDYLQDHFPYCPHWSDEKQKSSMAGGGGQKKRLQYCSDSSGTTLYLRALQGHSGRNLIDSFITGQCHYSGRFLRVHLSCRMCSHFTFHHQFRIDTGRTKFEQKTDSIFLLVDPMDKDHKDPDTIDLQAPSLAQYMHKAWKKHQNTVYLVDINLALKKGFEVLSDMIERRHSSRNTPSLLYPESCPPKISLKHHWMKELGSEVVRQPEGEVARQARSSQSTQPNPNPNHDRTGRPVVCSERAPRSQEIETRPSREEDVNHDRRGDPLFPHKERLKHVFLMTARTLIWKKKQITNERRDPLFALNQSVQCLTRLTSTSEYPDCHILLRNKLRTIVFVSSLSRSRTTLTDKIFNEIYNKIIRK